MLSEAPTRPPNKLEGGIRRGDSGSITGFITTPDKYLRNGMQASAVQRARACFCFACHRVGLVPAR